MPPVEPQLCHETERARHAPDGTLEPAGSLRRRVNTEQWRLSPVTKTRRFRRGSNEPGSPGDRRDRRAAGFWTEEAAGVGQGAGRGGEGIQEDDERRA